MQALNRVFFNKWCARDLFKHVVALLTVFLLTACGDPVQEQITQQLPITEQRIEQLGNALTNGQVRNANLINQYAEKVLAMKPNLITTDFRVSKRRINARSYVSSLA